MAAHRWVSFGLWLGLGLGLGLRLGLGLGLGLNMAVYTWVSQIIRVSQIMIIYKYIDRANGAN